MLRVRMRVPDNPGSIVALAPVTLTVSDMQVVYEAQASTGRIYWAESGLEELGGLPANHNVIAMHTFKYTLTLLGSSVTLRIGVAPQDDGNNHL